MKIILTVYIVVCGNDRKYINWSGRGPHTHIHTRQNVAKEKNVKKRKKKKSEPLEKSSLGFLMYTNCKYKH